MNNYNTTHKALYFLLGLICMAFTVTVAKEPTPLIRYININDGLSSPDIRDIIEDDLGNIWFAGAGAQRGFDIYDGHSIYNWEAIEGINPKLGNIFIARKTSDGKIWQTYSQKGRISILDPINRRIKYYSTLKMPNGEDFPLKNMKINAMAINEKHQCVWMLSKKVGLLKIVLDKNNEPLSIEKIDSPIDYRNKHTDAKMLIDKSGNFWVAHGGKLYLNQHNEKSDFMMIENTVSTHLDIKDIIQNKDGVILLATARGLYKVENKKIVYAFPEDHTLSQLSIKAIHQDEMGHYWLGGKIGLCRVNTLSPLEEVKVIAPELAGKRFITITSDSYGGIWFSLKLSGVGYIDLYGSSFGYLTANNNRNIDTGVNRIHKDKKGAFWMLTDKGLSIYDPKNGRYYHYKITSKTSIKTFSETPALGILESENGEMWISFINHHICKVEGNNYADLRFKWLKLDVKRFRNLNDMVIDKFGNLWMSSPITGIARFNPNTKEVKNFIGHGINKDVYTLNNDISENALWLGTYDKGVKKVYFNSKGEIEHIKTFAVNTKGDSTLRSMVIHYLKQDNNGRIWVGNRKGMVYRLDNTKTGMFKPLSNKFLIPKENIRQIQPDDNGNLWLAGNSLHFYNVKEKSIQTFSKEIIKNNLFTNKGAYKDQDGVLYFCGALGVNLTHPKGLKVSPYSPTVYLSELYISDKKVAVGDTLNNRVLLNKHLQNQSELTLYHKEKNIKFTARGIYPPSYSNLNYYYKLEGLDSEWSNSLDGKINFGMLPTGNYTLKLYVEDQFGHRSEIKTLLIHALPPWWETVWFRVMAIILILCTPYLIYRRKLVVLRRNKIKLEAIVKERTQEISAQNEEILSQRDHIQEQHAQLQEAYNDINHLNNIGKELSTIYDIEVVADITNQSINGFLDSDIFSIGVVKQKGNYLKLYNKKGSEKDQKRIHLHNDKDNLAVKCIHQKKEIVFSSKEAYEHSESGINSDIQSLICLPLIYQNKSLGVLMVQSKKVNAYTERHISILETLSAYLASTFENINSYDIILEKNENIIASIEYAKTIQRALLSSINNVINYFDEHFVLYQPKDIVSGDFYWAYQRENKLYLAVVDCTGHGVPGALLSVIGVNILNKVVGELKVDNPADILEGIDKEIKILLSQEVSRNDDGMDMSICVFDRNERGMQVSFAGAKANMRIIRNGNTEVETIKGTRRSIGGWSSNTKRDFEHETIILSEGDAVYLNTDGYIDQSNPEGRKVGTRRFVSLLEEISQQSMKEQKDMLISKLDNYKDVASQRDDITVLGVRV